MNFPRILIFVLLLSACGGGGSSSGPSPVTATAQTSQPTTTTATPITESPDNIDEQLEKLAGLSFIEFTDASFEMILALSPESQVSAGRLAPLRLDDISATAQAEKGRLLSGILDQLQTYTPTDSELTLHGLYAFYLQDAIHGLSFADFEFPGSYFLTSVPSQTELFFSSIHPLATAQDVDDYLARLRNVDEKFVQLRQLIQTAEANGIVMPRLLLDFSIGSHNQIAGVSAENTPYYLRLSNGIGATGLTALEQTAKLDDARLVINEQVRPAYRALVEQLTRQQVLAPAGIGVGQYNGGQEFYAYALRHHTTTDLSADSIHALGQQELDRIHAEMRAVFDDLGYPATASIRENLGRAGIDGGTVSAADVVSVYGEILAEADSRLNAAFSVFPQAELTIVGGPTGGFYIRPAADGSRPGAFHAANTRSEPRYLMKSLAYHEGVPGHHMQIAIAQEQASSLFQQTVTFTGFVEGWALYAERLAYELGWYDGDPYGNLGRLQYEAFRAARLVVDTGIHSRSWSFSDAAIFFSQNTGFSSGASENQIARYAIWPGQATAYMVGMLELLAYRREQQLDANFDLREFHDNLLTQGVVPLTMLRDES